MLRNIPIVKGRACDRCTACCEGWLWGNAHGFDFSPNNPCKFLGGKGCSIYDLRPANPCKTFLCHWKENTSIPDWLKPDKSNVIILKRQIGKFIYLRLVTTGKPPVPRVYDWANEMAEAGKHIIIAQETVVQIFSKDPGFEEALKQP